MTIITAGSDFCKLMRSTAGHQVLLTLEEDERGVPSVTATTTMVIDGAPCLVSDNAHIEPVLCEPLVRGPMTAQRELELADALVRRLTDMVLAELKDR